MKILNVDDYLREDCNAVNDMARAGFRAGGDNKVLQAYIDGIRDERANIESHAQVLVTCCRCSYSWTLHGYMHCKRFMDMIVDPKDYCSFGGLKK